MKVNENGRMDLQIDMIGKAGAVPEMDSESKEFQNQITNAQNRLQELSANHEMTDEEKKKKRQEIQKQITELNNQLRQHQIEMRREQQEKKKDAEDLPDGTQEKEKQQAAGLSQHGMKAVVSADSAVKQAEAQGRIAMEMENRVRVLQGEIKQDAGRGRDTERKQEELEALEKRAANISGAQMGILSDAAHKIKQVTELENGEDKKQTEEQKKISEKTVDVAMGAVSKNKTDIYTRGKIFSSVDIHI